MAQTRASRQMSIAHTPSCMNALSDLQKWYRSQCNGDWEHTEGVRIGTLDNPGWSLEVSLQGTNLEDADFKELTHGVGENAQTSGDDWLTCAVEQKRFKAFGGPFKLDEMIRVFLDWAKTKREHGDTARSKQEPGSNTNQTSSTAGLPPSTLHRDKDIPVNPASSSRPVNVFVDVDDTLVRSVGSKRIPIPSVIQQVRDLHAQGADLYCWSAGGAEYARRSAEEFGVAQCFTAFLPKPNVLIDDQIMTQWPRCILVHPSSCSGRSLDDYRAQLR